MLTAPRLVEPSWWPPARRRYQTRPASLAPLLPLVAVRQGRPYLDELTPMAPDTYTVRQYRTLQQARLAASRDRCLWVIPPASTTYVVSTVQYYVHSRCNAWGNSMHGGYVRLRPDQSQTGAGMGSTVSVASTLGLTTLPFRASLFARALLSEGRNTQGEAALCTARLPGVALGGQSP